MLVRSVQIISRLDSKRKFHMLYYFTSGAPYSCVKQKESPWVEFLMVTMVSDIARGRVSTTATESRNMAAILEIMGWQRPAALVYCALLWYWTSILRSIETYQNKVSTDQYHVIISQAQVYSSSRSSFFFKLTADQVLTADLFGKLFQSAR